MTIAYDVKNSCVRMSTRWARNFFGRLLGLKFVRALNNYSKWRRFWTSPVQVTKNLESSRLACTGIPSTTGSPKITKRSPNVERKYSSSSYETMMKHDLLSFSFAMDDMDEIFLQILDSV